MKGTKDDEKRKQEGIEQRQREKEFHKTTFGKFIGITLIVACVGLVLWIIIAGIEAALYAKNLDVDKYKLLFDFKDSLLDFSLYGSIICSCAYGLYTKKEDEKSEKDNVKKYETKEKSKKVMKVLMIIILLSLYTSLFYNIGYIIGYSIK